MHSARTVARVRGSRLLNCVLALVLLLTVAPDIHASAQAPEPQLFLTPDVALAGDRVTATGSAFPPTAEGQLLWSDDAPLAAFTTDASGAFTVDVTVPEVEPGQYVVTAVVGAEDGAVSAEAALVVEAPELPTPTPEPTVTPTVEPTPPPMQAPTPTMPPTPVPTVAATAAPTVAATTAPTPATVSTTDAPQAPPAETPAATATPAPTNASEAPGTGATGAVAATSTVPGSVTFAPVADARVEAVRPDQNYGSDPTLIADTNPNREMYLRFELTGLSGPVETATLRLFVTNGTVNGPSVAASADTSWTESGITWNTKPAIGAGVDNKATVPGNAYVDFDVTSLVPGEGDVTLALIPDNADGLYVNAREAASNPPQLIVSTGEAAPTATTAPPTPEPTADPTATPTPEPPPTPRPLEQQTFVAVEDAQVRESTPKSNYGTSPVLRADHGDDPEVQTFLKFIVTGLDGAPASATLWLHVDSGGDAPSNDGPALYTVDSTSWSESGITWSTRPAPGATALGDLGAVTKGSWVAYDVSPAITGNGTYAFVLRTTSADAADFDSRETDTPPRLEVMGVLSGPEPTSVPPSPEPTSEPSTPVPTVTGEPTVAPTATTSPTPAPGGGSAILLAAGDIASCSSDADSLTADIVAGQAGTVATLGDNAYESGTAQQFKECYDPTWGPFKDRTKPVPGNHEYNTSGASGYYDYFGAAAGDPAKGYYSYDLGSWHIVALNSNIDMKAGSTQEQWLRKDLAAHPTACTLAYWHHPRFSSSSTHGNTSSTGPLFQALYDYGAEIVLAGHDHTYERYAPQTPGAQADFDFGIREFVVGTGGKNLYGLGSAEPNSEVRNNKTYGVLKLTLSADGYTWEFLPVAGASFTDSGSGTCHGAPGSAITDGAPARNAHAAMLAAPVAVLARIPAAIVDRRTLSRRPSP